MQSLAAKYMKLKRLVGGNREKTGYEETFGMPKEEFWKITMPNRYIRRILAQTEFAIRLSRQLEGKFDHVLHDALDFMQNAMDQDGVLTQTVCLKAEEKLAVMSDAAKEYELILAAHAHIDMNWMWGWQETVAITIATVQTMLNLMREYPDFHFSQSQASVYQIIDDYAPELKPEILSRIKEGRWEITASAWVETDKNMPNTESLLQHMYQTKTYLRDEWGIDPKALEIDFSPDTFGHSANLPELDALGGVKYYYHCRALDGDYALYRWKAPSGKEMLVYREQYWYNSGITPAPGIGLIDIANRSGGLKSGLVVYGVGDHGGGPTRRDLERAMEMMEWPVFPQIRFGTFKMYFEKAEQVRGQLPIIDHELNFIFPGCYTTQSRIKLANRKTELALFEGQLWDAAISSRSSMSGAARAFAPAWRSVLFTHFHDILTGSCVQETREHAMGQFAHAMAIAQSRASFAMQEIVKRIDTSGIAFETSVDSQSEGAGAGFGLEHYTGMPAPERGQGKTRVYHLFNAASIARAQPSEITIWDWTGDMRDIAVFGPQGEEIPFQLLDEEMVAYWDHKYFRILVVAQTPAFGYTTIVLRERQPDDYRIYYQPTVRTDRPSENITLENEWLRAEFRYDNGEIISLKDKITGKEMLKLGESGGLRVVQTEKKTSNAWNIGRYLGVSGPLEAIELEPFEGSLMSGFILKQRFGASTAKSVISLSAHAQAVSIEMTVDWHEVTGETTPVLIYQIPIQGVDTYLYDVPGGAQYRKAMGLDAPGLQYGAAVNGKRVTALFADCKYGYRGDADRLSCTLINATYSPDPYPERGIHSIRLHIAALNNHPKTLADVAGALHHAPSYQSGVAKQNKGDMPLTDSLFQAELGTAVVSGISIQDGTLTLRLYETCGIETKVLMNLQGTKWKQMQSCDLMGEPLSAPEKAVDGVFSMSLTAHETKMFKWTED